LTVAFTVGQAIEKLGKYFVQLQHCTYALGASHRLPELLEGLAQDLYRDLCKVAA
jgi:hypothetical protein